MPLTRSNVKRAVAARPVVLAAVVVNVRRFGAFPATRGGVENGARRRGPNCSNA